MLRYGSGDARLTGAFRTDGIIRALGGIYLGAFTTTQRDAIPSGSRPYGLAILNTTTNRWELNLGTDAAPIWIGIGASTVTSGTLAARPGASNTNANTWYFATDVNGGTLYFSNGSSWVKAALGLSEPSPIADGSVTTAKYADSSVTSAKLSPQTISVKAGSYSLVVGDRFTLIRMDGGGVVTIPANASQPFQVGDSVDIVQWGTGQVTLAPAGGVTLLGNPGLRTNGQYSVVTVIKMATDTWLAAGALTT